ncbi:MAG TPA: MBL fold metallo-hydrolase [Solirubrobacteraceae bacterium]|nr:MBL fold metallo-hydrolase [Solirubrobacteraceae bacterium]
MRVVSLHPDVLLATSSIWQTNCLIVRGPGKDSERGGDDARAGERVAGEGLARESARLRGETFVIDSPVLPDELDALPALAEQARFPEPTGLIATHGDWDHLLGRLAFPDLALGCAETTAARLAGSPGEAQRELRTFDRRFYVERHRPLQLGQVQALPVPGRLDIGEQELQLYPAEGHTPDGMAVWIGWAGVLVAGDYLSTVEPPEIDGVSAGTGAFEMGSAATAATLGSAGSSPVEAGAAETYIATLERLRPLVEAAAHIVPGHGPVLDATRARGVLEEHLSHLRALTRAT